MTRPGLQRQAAAGAAVVRDVRVAVHRAADAVAAEVGVDRVALGLRDVARSRGRCRRCGCPGRAAAMPASRARRVVSMSRRSCIAGRADDDRDRRVGHPAVHGCREVEAQQVAVAQPVVVGESVQHRVVHRGADDLAERAARRTRGGSRCSSSRRPPRGSSRARARRARAGSRRPPRPSTSPRARSPRSGRRAASPRSRRGSSVRSRSSSPRPFWRVRPE